MAQKEVLITEEEFETLIKHLETTMHHCHNDFRHTRAWLQEHHKSPRVIEVLRDSNFAYCDCEIVLNWPFAYWPF